MKLCRKGHDTDVTPRYASGHCRLCRTAGARAWAATNPARYANGRHNISWKRQGIINADGSPFKAIDYDRAYQVQQGKCRGCGRHQSELAERLQADHNHNTGVFRALLCHLCNRLLGSLEHNPERVRNLIGLLGNIDVRGV